MRQVVDTGADGLTVNFPEKLLAMDSAHHVRGNTVAPAPRLIGSPARPPELAFEARQDRPEKGILNEAH